MEEFDQSLLSLIGEYELSATEIERALFTKMYNLNEKHYALLSVQSISILYSYWEGFIQRAFQMYIDYLNEKNIVFRCLNENIVIFHMENSFKQFREYPKNLDKKIKFFQKLKAHYSQDFHPIYRVVNTESNVNFKILNRLMEQFNLEPFSSQWSNYRHPDSNLENSLNSFVRYRDGVAHGGDISSEEKISQAVYTRYRKLVSDLMYEIRERFLKGIEKQSYLNSDVNI